jgi:hypothetical protein
MVLRVSSNTVILAGMQGLIGSNFLFLGGCPVLGTVESKTMIRRNSNTVTLMTHGW